MSTMTRFKTASIHDSVSSLMAMTGDTTDLRVLQKIESTMEVLLKHRRFFDSHANLGRVVAEKIANATVVPGDYADPDGALDTLLTNYAALNEQLLVIVQKKKKCVDRDRQLKPHHCDQLHSAYDELLEAIRDDSESARDVAAALVTHDLAAEPAEGPSYATVEALHEALAHE